MDNFMDKLTHRFTSQDAIRANSEADAKALDNAKAKMSEYDKALSEIRRLSLKCVETNEATNQLIQAGVEKFEGYTGIGCAEGGISEDALSELKKSVEEGIKGQEDFIHKENVRVYRNVQAAVVDELKLQTEALAIQSANLEKKVKGLKGLAITSMIFGIISALAIAGGLIIQIFDITF